MFAKNYHEYIQNVTFETQMSHVVSYIRNRLGVKTTPSLKRLFTVFLPDDFPGFQSGPHNPKEDAIA